MRSSIREKFPGRAEDTPKEHLAVSIVVDKSESTADIHDLLNTCTRDLVTKLKKDLLFKGIVELQVVFFSGTYQEADFVPLEQISPSSLVVPKSEGYTHTGQALLYALEQLQKKKNYWKQKAEHYYQPMLFLLTDGFPDAGEGAPDDVVKDVREAYEMAGDQIKKLESSKPNESPKLLFVAAGIERKNGISANMDKLRELSSHPERILSVTHGNGLNGIEKFFDLIYQMTYTMGMQHNTPSEEKMARDLIRQIFNQ